MSKNLIIRTEDKTFDKKCWCWIYQGANNAEESSFEKTFKERSDYVSRQQCPKWRYMKSLMLLDKLTVYACCNDPGAKNTTNKLSNLNTRDIK